MNVEKYRFEHVSSQQDRIGLVHLPEENHYVQASSNHFAEPIFVRTETEVNKITTQPLYNYLALII